MAPALLLVLLALTWPSGAILIGIVQSTTLPLQLAYGTRMALRVSCTMQAMGPRPGSLAEAIKVQGKRPYGEESRRYRRTIYRHDDWLKHRSETRLLRNLKGLLTSGVVRSLIAEVALVALVAVLVIVWNGALFGYVDFSNISQIGLFGEMPAFLQFRLPITIFTLSSPALALLLVFRTNTSYARWVEARIAWGRIVSHSRNIMRQATLWIDMDDPAAQSALDELRMCLWAFPRSLWAHVSDPRKEPRFRAEMVAEMGEEGAARVLEASNRPLRALQLLSVAMDRLPVDEKKRLEMDKSVILLSDALEVCNPPHPDPNPNPGLNPNPSLNPNPTPSPSRTPTLTPRSPQPQPQRLVGVRAPLFEPGPVGVHAAHGAVPLALADPPPSRSMGGLWHLVEPLGAPPGIRDHCDLPVRHRGACGAA